MIASHIDSFMHSCGADTPLRILTAWNGLQGEQARSFEQPFVLIGRDSRADLSLDHWQISQCHVYLQMINGRPFAVDLSSRTGTRWADACRSSGWLHRAQPLQVGPFWIWPDCGDDRENVARQERNPLATHFVEPDDRPALSVEVLNRKKRQDPRPIHRTLALVGRAANCQVRLMGDSVSLHSCSLLRTPGGVWAIDLLSREGLLVNGERVRWARLEDGDELQIGRFRLLIHLSEAKAVSFGSDGDAWTESTPAVERIAPRVRWRRSPSTSRQSSESTTITANGDGGWRAPVPNGSDRPNGRWAEWLIVPLAKQAAIMQQQMTSQFQQVQAMQRQVFDQFHEAMSGMLETFQGMYQHHREVVQQELAQIQALTSELRAAYAELARGTPGSMKSPTAERDWQATDPIRGPVQDVRLRSCRTPIMAGANGAKQTPPAEDRSIPFRRAAAEPKISGQSGQQAKFSPQSTAESQDQVHAWLHERIESLNRERAGRWKRLVSYLIGAQADTNAI